MEYHSSHTTSSSDGCKNYRQETSCESLSLNDVVSHADKAARHHLFFSRSEVEGVDYADIGLLLSQIIIDCLEKRQLPMIADDHLNRIIEAHTHTVPGVGEVVGIKNFNILFEPQLGINLHAKIDSFAKSKYLFVKQDGELTAQRYYMTDHTKPEFSIDLSGISTTTLHDEI